MKWDLLGYFLLNSINSLNARIAGPRGGLSVGFDHSTNTDSNGGFDYLMLTLIYPEAVCRADDDTIVDSCEIPDGTPKWTVHGLWPNYQNGSYPQFCTRQKFDIDAIQPIFDKLKQDWPNLYPKRSVSSLWKHEWEKHGTCALSDPILDSQLNYFKSTLDQLSVFNVEKALADQQILPSEDQYTVDQIGRALTDGLTGGKRVRFNCLTDKKTKQTLFGDVRICLNLDLKPIDCPERGRGSTKLYSQPHLPDFQPCRGEITYLPSDSESRFEKMADLSLRIMPVPTILGVMTPILGMLAAILFLATLMLSLCIYNYRILVENRVFETEKFKRIKHKLLGFHERL